MTLTAQPTLTDRITIEPARHRFERLRTWMEAENLVACVTFGPKHASHLAGSARYYGGPAAVVVSRDGARTLVVMYDEAPVARELGDADAVKSYGERGFGINLENWMVLAVAPGIYFPGRVGARVENLFVVTPDGGVELRDAFGTR